MMRSREQLEEALREVEREIAHLRGKRNELDERIKSLYPTRGALKKRLRTQDNTNQLPPNAPPSQPVAVQKRNRALVDEWDYFITQDFSKKHKFRPLSKTISSLRGKLGSLRSNNLEIEWDFAMLTLAQELPVVRKSLDLEFERIQKIIFSE